ncbi:MAG: putative metal-dependent hydrolase [Acidobacteria bacterium]|nr:putative metal-dependent hydrolase [Acidobacteriota bacterium]
MPDPRYPIGPFVAPDNFSEQGRVKFIASIEATPARLRAAIDGLSTAQLLQPYRDGGWTCAQVIHHVADSHMNAYMRFKLAATDDNPFVTGFNEAQWAECPDATSPDIGISLSLVDGVHARWVTFLRSLDAKAFDRTFQHSKNGPVSLNLALALYAWHGRHHTAHITSLRERMGW